MKKRVDVQTRETRFHRGSFVVAMLVAATIVLPSPASAARIDASKKTDAWFRSPEGRRIVDNILSWQSVHGTWPKNLDTSAEPYRGDRREIRGTFDNSATTNELRLLAAAFRATGDTRCRDAFLEGFDAILEAQYPTGGWPQSFPPVSGYDRHITFNDGAMQRILELLREVATSPDYAFLEKERRRAAQGAFERGIRCILKCQIVVDGTLTVWCAQHDAVDYRPRAARSYELESLSGGESTSILRLLMSLDNPSPAVIQAIDAGARWFESAKLTGIRYVKIDGDRRIVKDADAPPLWARFYDIDTNRPFFCGRDGVKKDDVSEIESERRNGYSWYGSYGAQVATDYARWKEKWSGEESR